MATPENRKLIVPLMIFIGMVAVGVNSINKAIDSHQTWRLVIAVIPTLMFSAATILVIMKYKYEDKAHEESSENHFDQ
jgi:predicted membrane channel-forming protein YqfA (hemolysin III family)